MGARLNFLFQKHLRASSNALGRLARALLALSSSRADQPGDAASEVDVISNHQEGTGVLERMVAFATAAPDLPRERERELCRLAREGCDDARRELVAANMKRVLLVARSYRNMGVSLEDLVHEGVIGLMEAVRRFDPERDVRLFTYASFLVRRHLVQAVARGAKQVRVPRHLAARLRRLREERDRLRAAGRPATARHAARSLGLQGRQAEACAALPASYEVSVDDDGPRQAGGPRRRQDLLRAPPESCPEARVVHDQALSQLQAALELLPPRDRRVLEDRFGLGGRPARTLRDLSARMNLSKERVRQLEARAKAALRAHLEGGRSGPGAGTPAAWA